MATKSRFHGSTAHLAKMQQNLRSPSQLADQAEVWWYLGQADHTADHYLFNSAADGIAWAKAFADHFNAVAGAKLCNNPYWIRVAVRLRWIAAWEPQHDRSGRCYLTRSPIPLLA